MLTIELTFAGLTEVLLPFERVVTELLPLENVFHSVVHDDRLNQLPAYALVSPVLVDTKDEFECILVNMLTESEGDEGLHSQGLTLDNVYTPSD